MPLITCPQVGHGETPECFQWKGFGKASTANGFFRFFFFFKGGSEGPHMFDHVCFLGSFSIQFDDSKRVVMLTQHLKLTCLMEFDCMFI